MVGRGTVVTASRAALAAGACLPTKLSFCPSTAVNRSLVVLSPPLSSTTSYALKAWAFLAIGLILHYGVLIT